MLLRAHAGAEPHAGQGARGRCYWVPLPVGRLDFAGGKVRAEVLAAAAASLQAEAGRSPQGIGGTGLIDRKFVGLVGVVKRLISADADA